MNASAPPRGTQLREWYDLVQEAYVARGGKGFTDVELADRLGDDVPLSKIAVVRRMLVRRRLVYVKRQEKRDRKLVWRWHRA